jgi:hypothetical protein
VRPGVLLPLHAPSELHAAIVSTCARESLEPLGAQVAGAALTFMIRASEWERSSRQWARAENGNVCRGEGEMRRRREVAVAVTTGRQTENQNAGRGQTRDGTEDWRVRGTVMNGCWPRLVLCSASLLLYTMSPGTRYCQRAAIVVEIAATRGQQEMKRLSARQRGDPGRTLPLGNRTPVAGGGRGEWLSCKSASKSAPFVERRA